MDDLFGRSGEGVLAVALHAAPPRPPSPSRRSVLAWALAGAAVALAVLALVVLAAPQRAAPQQVVEGTSPTADAPSSGSAVASDVALPLADTSGVVPAAPLDDAPTALTDGVVVRPIAETLVHGSPGGPAIARLPVKQFGATWLPVIAERDGWVRVLLPSKPNASTGWLAGADVRKASTPYLVRVHLGSFRMELLRGGVLDQAWTVGTGKASAPTPPGRTFVLGAFTDRQQTFSPVILPLGTHSPTHDTFGGGPGTVAIHTWPTADVYGTASSDGCIRVPKDALDRLTEVPLGTLVLIDER